MLFCWYFCWRSCFMFKSWLQQNSSTFEQIGTRAHTFDLCAATAMNVNCWWIGLADFRTTLLPTITLLRCTQYYLSTLVFFFQWKSENDCARARTKKSFAALMIEINSVTSLVVLWTRFHSASRRTGKPWWPQGNCVSRFLCTYMVDVYSTLPSPSALSMNKP